MSDDINFVVKITDEASKSTGTIITGFEKLGKSADKALDKDLGKALIRSGSGIGKFSKLVGSATSGLDNMGAVGIASTKSIGQGLLVATSILPTLIDQVNDFGPAIKGALAGVAEKAGAIEAGSKLGSGFVKGAKGIAIVGIAAMGAEMIEPLNRAGDDMIHHLFDFKTADEVYATQQFTALATKAVTDGFKQVGAAKVKNAIQGFIDWHQYVGRPGEDLGAYIGERILAGTRHKFLGGDAVTTTLMPVMRHSGMVTGHALTAGFKAATTNVGRYVATQFAPVGRITGDAIRAGMSNVKSAAAQLVWEFQHPLNLAKKKTELLGILHGKLLAKGLASKDPDTRAAAQKLKEGVEAELALIAARQAGDKKGAEFKAALMAQVAATERAVAAAVIRINAALNAGTSNNANRGDTHRASGGPVFAGNTYQVGERGPETLVMGAGAGYVIPGGRGGGGGGGTVNLTLSSLVPYTAAQLQQAARVLGPELARYFRGQGLRLKTG